MSLTCDGRQYLHGQRQGQQLRKDLQTRGEGVRCQRDELDDLANHFPPDPAGRVESQDGDDVLANLLAQMVAHGCLAHHASHSVNLDSKG